MKCQRKNLHYDLAWLGKIVKKITLLVTEIMLPKDSGVQGSEVQRFKLLTRNSGP